MNKKKEGFICEDCFKLKKCREKTISWVFFFTALIATISIRMVNLALGFHPLLAKIFWYIGIIGFFIFFIYKFRNDQILHRELERTKVLDKLLNKDNVDEHDYELLGTVLCRLSSKKDKINYFFIFFFSGAALIAALYTDFLKNLF